MPIQPVIRRVRPKLLEILSAYDVGRIKALLVNLLDRHLERDDVVSADAIFCIMIMMETGCRPVEATYIAEKANPEPFTRFNVYDEYEEKLSLGTGWKNLKTKPDGGVYWFRLNLNTPVLKYMRLWAIANASTTYNRIRKTFKDITKVLDIKLVDRMTLHHFRRFKSCEFMMRFKEYEILTAMNLRENLKVIPMLPFDNTNHADIRTTKSKYVPKSFDSDESKIHRRINENDKKNIGKSNGCPRS